MAKVKKIFPKKKKKQNGDYFQIFIHGITEQCHGKITLGPSRSAIVMAVSNERTHGCMYVLLIGTFVLRAYRAFARTLSVKEIFIYLYFLFIQINRQRRS